MAFESVHIDTVLAAAIGDDPALNADLRHAFLQSAQEHLRTLAHSTSVPEWHMAALRFKGLCVGFGIAQLSDLADRAAVAPKGDPGLLRKINAALRSLTEAEARPDGVQ